MADTMLPLVIMAVLANKRLERTTDGINFMIMLCASDLRLICYSTEILIYGNDGAIQSTKEVCANEVRRGSWSSRPFTGKVSGSWTQFELS